MTNKSAFPLDFDVGKVEFFFMFFRPSARNNVRAGFALRPYQKHHLTIEQTEALQ